MVVDLLPGACMRVSCWFRGSARAFAPVTRIIKEIRGADNQMTRFVTGL